MEKQYITIDRMKILAIEEAAVEKAMNNKEQPLSEASIEARAVLQVIHVLYQLNETKSDLELQNQ
jgi:hypothetical protein